MKVRKYDMSTRAAAKTATRDAIIRACIDAVIAERSFAVTLAAVADRANVTVKTVLRHFGSRDAVVDAAWTQLYDEVIAERRAPTDDPEAALAILIDHYERRGDLVLATLASEEDDSRARRTGDWGRLHHRAWVEEVFAAQLPTDRDARTRLVDVLVVATDVYSWKLLRRDRGLSVDDVRDRMLLMTAAILTVPAEPQERGAP